LLHEIRVVVEQANERRAHVPASEQADPHGLLAHRNRHPASVFPRCDFSVEMLKFRSMNFIGPRPEGPKFNAALKTRSRFTIRGAS
jgi:hypothetical protein